MTTATARGLTTAEFCGRYRMGWDKLKGMILRGEVRAINTSTSLSARPRYIIPPEAVAEFEQRRTAAQVPTKPKRRRKITAHDYYPD